MTLNNDLHSNLTLNEVCGRHDNPKFSFTECPFVPSNKLSSKYYTINFMDDKFEFDKKRNNESFNLNNEKNISNTTNSTKCKNLMHIYQNKGNNCERYRKYDRRGEINNETVSDDFMNRTFCEGDKINHGRGKEKLLSPRKLLICDDVKREVQEGGKSALVGQKSALNQEQKRSNVSKDCGISIENLTTKERKGLRTQEETEFVLCAEIKIKTDVSKRKNGKQTFCFEHQTENLRSCIHSEDQEFVTKTPLKEEKKFNSPVKVTIQDASDIKIRQTENRHCTTENIYKGKEKLRETQFLKKLLSESRKQSDSRISDLYEEEQFVYDPESNMVTHSTVTKSRSENFLDYFNQLNNVFFRRKANTMPHNELQNIVHKHIQNIRETFQEPTNKSETPNLKDKKIVTITKSLPLKISKNPFNTDFSARNYLTNDNLLIIERFKNYQLSEAHVEHENNLRTNEQDISDCSHVVENDKMKSETLPSIHRRPELQKRYFYSKFKTYKKGKIEDDISYVDQVKSAKDKFEKLFYDLAIKKNNRMAESSNCQEHMKTVTDNLKNSLKFVSEDNICLLGKEKKPVDQILKKPRLSTDSKSSESNKSSSDISAKEPALKSIKQLNILSRSHSTDQLFRLKHKTISVDNLCLNNSIKETNSLLETNESSEEEGKSEENHSEIETVQNDEFKCDKIKSETCNSQFEKIKTNIKEIAKFDEKEIKDKVCWQENKINNECDETLKPNITKHRENKISSKDRKFKTDLKKNNKLMEDIISRNGKHLNDYENLEDIFDEKNKKSLVRRRDNVSCSEIDENSSADDNNLQDYFSETSRDSDSLENFGRPVSEEMMRKIRACGTSITYFGGKVISRKYGPMCSPMTMTIINEIKQYMSVLNEHMHKPNVAREI